MVGAVLPRVLEGVEATANLRVRRDPWPQRALCGPRETATPVRQCCAFVAGNLWGGVSTRFPVPAARQFCFLFLMSSLCLSSPSITADERLASAGRRPYTFQMGSHREARCLSRHRELNRGHFTDNM